MSVSPKVKVCGMRDSHNIDAIAKLKPDYMGFIFYPKSPRFLGDDYNASALGRIPKTIKKTGVFVNATEDEIAETIVKFDLQAAQLHGNESPDLCSKVKAMNVEVIKAFQVGEDFDFDVLNPYNGVCDYFLFDTKTKHYGGSGHKFDWKILDKYDNDIPVFLSGGISIDDVEDVKKLQHLNIYAVDINSKFEVEPALKNVEMVSEFMTKLKNN